MRKTTFSESRDECRTGKKTMRDLIRAEQSSMHKNNIRFVHTYDAAASFSIVRSPERLRTIDNEERVDAIFHVDPVIE